MCILHQGPDEVTLVHDKGNRSRKSPALQLQREGVDLVIDEREFKDIGRIIVVGEIEDMTTERLFLKDGDAQHQRRVLRDVEHAKESKAGLLRIRIKGMFGAADRLPATRGGSATSARRGGPALSAASRFGA